MPRAQEDKKEELTREERRQRRLLRREKQRKDNIGRSAKMHAARRQMETDEPCKSVSLEQVLLRRSPGRGPDRQAARASRTSGRCSFRKLDSGVSTVEAAKDRIRNNVSEPLDRTCAGRVAERHRGRDAGLTGIIVRPYSDANRLRSKTSISKSPSRANISCPQDAGFPPLSIITS